LGARDSIQLPRFPQVSQELRNGRSIHDGYVRGWGLQFGDLLQQIERDNDYQACFSIAQGRTIQNPASRANLFLLIAFYLPPLSEVGHIVEFGSYKGGSALFMAAAAKRFLPNTRVFAFDTFQGMPATDRSIDLHSAGDFSDVDLDDLRNHSVSS